MIIFHIYKVDSVLLLVVSFISNHYVVVWHPPYVIIQVWQPLRKAVAPSPTVSAVMIFQSALNDCHEELGIESVSLGWSRQSWVDGAVIRDDIPYVCSQSLSLSHP